MNDIYFLKSNASKVLRGSYTNFLDRSEEINIKKFLKKSDYQVLEVFDECSKVILYSGKKPDICLLEVLPKKEIRHQDILGSLFALNIDSSTFGDIVIKDGRYFLYCLKNICNYIMSNLIMIGNTSCEIKEIDVDYLSDYKIDFTEEELIVSSLRIDSIVSKIINSNRGSVLDKIHDKEIILNYEVVSKPSKILRENDIFSVRKYGKYKVGNIVAKTKRGNYILKIYKYN